MARATLLALVLLLPGAPSAATQAAPLTAWEAVRIALQTHPRVRAAEAEAQAEQEGALQALASFAPQIALSASASVSDRNARFQDGGEFGDATSPASAAITLSQSLYSSGRRALTARSAQLRRRAGQLSIAAEREQLALDVMAAFYEVVRNEAALAIEREVQALLSSQADAARRRQEAGAGTRTDVAFAQSRMADSRARLASARANLIAARAELEALIGFEPPALDPSPPLSRADVAYETALDEARIFNLQLERTRLAEIEARLAAAQAARRYGPQVELQASLQTVRESTPLIDRDDEARASVTFSMPLYSGGAAASARRQGRARERGSSSHT